MTTTSPTSHSHSLLYFDGAGRAEAVRILLSIAGVAYDDVRISYAEWNEGGKKADTPLGNVPVLTIDGVPHVQSNALARYAARLAGWYPARRDGGGGNDDPRHRHHDDHDVTMASLCVDEVSDCLAEVFSNAPKSGDPGELYRLRTDYQDGFLTGVARFLEGRIQGGDRTTATAAVGFTPTFGITVADLQLYLTVQAIRSGMFDHIEMTFFDAYPGIMATFHTVQDHPAIKEYYSNAKK